MIFPLPLFLFGQREKAAEKEKLTYKKWEVSREPYFPFVFSGVQIFSSISSSVSDFSPRATRAFSAASVFVTRKIM